MVEAKLIGGFMGLDCSHDAFHGAYSAFNSFRQAVAWAVGGSYPPHWVRHEDGTPLDRDDSGFIPKIPGYDDDQIYWPESLESESPGVMIFLLHSDCDGEIGPEDCAIVARDLSKLVGKIKFQAYGHIERDGGYDAVLQRFIDGCNEAHAKGEPLDFH